MFFNERATRSFRDGFNDGYFGKPRLYSAPADSIKPFGEFDYNEGYESGKAQAAWNRMPLSERRKEAKRRNEEAKTK